MFNDFFDKHIPETMELPSAESAARIDPMLREKMNEIREEKPMKKKTIKSFILIAAAAVLTATALIFSATADYNGDEKYVVRINNKRADAEVYTYENGRVKLGIVSYEVPCEMLIDRNGKPVTEDSGIDRREFHYDLHIYASEDPNEQVWDPETGVKMVSGGGGGYEMYIGDAMPISVPSGFNGTNTLEFPVVLNRYYDEKKAKEFWENYWKDPEEGARKWVESWGNSYQKEELSEAEILKKCISKHFNEYMTEAEKNGVLEYIDQTFGEESAE
ncbi:MAG: hypothetical protein K2N56_09135 [Oscillospiraceae bacterium]|nr:hypothetical protein [Oscillospiraceae bacterium]